MPEASVPLVRYERHGAVAHLIIDHPPVNVLSAAVLDALVAGLQRAHDDLSARVVVLRGAAEKAFAAGANIREMAPMGPAEARQHGGRGQAVTVAIERLPIPVIAAVHGSCLGGGCEIAMSCDFIIAADDAWFGQPEINLGVMPGWGGTRRLPRRIGAAEARAWILLGSSVKAEDAKQMGLVYRVVPRGELLEAAESLAQDLAAKPPVALAAAKFALNRAIDPLSAEGLEYELALWAELFGTPDQKEGMAAFLEKRKGSFAARPPWSSVADRFPVAPGERSGREKSKT